MTSNTNGQEKLEAFLPPVELLHKYEELGMGGDLIGLIKKEQAHRHQLQKKYLMCYRFGQILSFFLIALVSCGIYNLFVNELKIEAYISMVALIATMFGVLFIIRKDKAGLAKIKQVASLKKNNTIAQRFSSGGRKNFYRNSK